MVSSNVVLTEKHLNEVVERFSEHSAFAFDVETVGEFRKIPSKNRVTWVSLATKGMAYVIPMGHPIGSRQIGTVKEPRVDKNGKIRRFTVPVWDDPPEQLPPGIVWSALRPLFFSDQLKVGSNIIFDICSSEKSYPEKVMPGPFWDTQVCDWLLNENRKKYGLKKRIEDLFGFSYDDENVGKCVEKHPFNKVAHYSYCDAKMTWLQYKHQRPLLADWGLEWMAEELEMALIPVLCEMKRTGAPVDVPRLEEMREELSERLEKIEGKVYSAAGKVFNINSPQQKVQILFGPKSEGGQGLKPWKLTKGGVVKEREDKPLLLTDYSTDSDVLESFPKNPVAGRLLEYAEVSKINGTYVESWLGVDGDPKKPTQIFDGRIYTDFVQNGTVSGRFSSRAPNLQNIPRPGTDLGQLVRGAFIGASLDDPTGKLIVADYGQIELVILAHYLGKGKLYEGFLQGIDPHTQTAAGVLGKAPDAITGEERGLYGKALNFACNYGVGPQKVANMLGRSLKEAKEILSQHQDKFPETYAFKDAVLKKARSRKPPYIRTLLGRYRRLPGLHSQDFGTRGYAERQAFNSLIQGGSADLTKLAMIRVHSKLPSEIKVILTVHDEIVLSSPEHLAEEGAAILHEAMVGEGIKDLLRVPMEADVKIVSRWAEAK